MEKCQNFDEDKDFNHFTELTENRPKSNYKPKIACTKDLCLLTEDGENHEKEEEVRRTSGISPFQNDSSSYRGEVEKSPQKW